MKEISKKEKAGAILISLLVCGYAVGFVGMDYFNIDMPTIFEQESKETYIEMRDTWRPLPLGADPGAGNSGVLRGFICQTGLTLTNNVSYGNMYAVENTTDQHANPDVPYETAFVVGYLVRFNRSDAFSTTNATWMLSWVRANITNPTHSLSDEPLTKYNISGAPSGSDYMYVNFVARNGGVGYQLTRGQNATQSEATVDVYR